MAILDFQPHYLWQEVVTEGHEDRETGDWIDGESEWQKYVKCDITPAVDENRLVPIPDGSVVEYDYVVHLPQTCRKFEVGERVKLTLFDNDEERIYTVTGFHRYQLKCKMWIKGI